MTYSGSSKPQSCSLKIKHNFIDSVEYWQKESFQSFEEETTFVFVVEDTYRDVNKKESNKIRLSLISELWATGAAIKSYKLIKRDRQESLLELELVNSEQRADIMRKDLNAALSFICQQDIDKEQAQQEEQQSRRSFMGVIRNAASYVASWFKRS